MRKRVLMAVQVKLQQEVAFGVLLRVLSEAEPDAEVTSACVRVGARVGDFLAACACEQGESGLVAFGRTHMAVLMKMCER